MELFPPPCLNLFEFTTRHLCRNLRRGTPAFTTVARKASQAVLGGREGAAALGLIENLCAIFIDSIVIYWKGLFCQHDCCPVICDPA